MKLSKEMMEYIEQVIKAWEKYRTAPVWNFAMDKDYMERYYVYGNMVFYLFYGVVFYNTRTMGQIHFFIN